jgi:uncharacterized membrane protein
VRGRTKDPARREQRAARRRRLAAALAAVAWRRVVALVLMLTCLALVFAGVVLVFGVGWAMIVTGVLAGVLSLLTGWE